MSETKWTPGPWYVVGPPWLPPNTEPYIVAGSPDPQGGQIVCDFPDVGTAGLEDRFDDDEWQALCWDNARLLAAAPDLYDALAFIERRARQEGEGVNEHYERVAEEFMLETGMMAPGKDDAAGYHSPEARRAAWDEFCGQTIISARKALAKARGYT